MKTSLGAVQPPSESGRTSSPHVAVAEGLQRGHSNTAGCVQTSINT